MISGISWGDYLAGVAILSTCYYLGVAFIFYRDEIQRFRFSRVTGNPSAPQDPDDGEALRLFEEPEKIIKETNSILEAAGQGAGKPELLQQLRHCLANHTGLRKSVYRGAVLNQIVRKADEQCGIRISVDELEADGTS